MPSSSCTDLVALAAGRESEEDFPTSLFPLPRLPRVTTPPASAVPDSDDAATSSCSSPHSPSRPPGLERRIIVSNHLPIRASRDADSASWNFIWDQDALVLQLKSGFPAEAEVVYVGTIRGAECLDASEQDAVAQRLYDDFRCVPVFLEPVQHQKFYHGFCKHYLWPLFHYNLPINLRGGGGGGGGGGRGGGRGCEGNRFDRNAWRAYLAANRAFADRVVEVIDPDEDFVWVHDYHLMALPNNLRRRFHRIKLGFFLHSPFPSSEIYRTIPVRDELLKALLNTDLVGFHTFDYARHFLSCCSRMLGLDYESRRGHLGLEYYGRNVSVKILPAGIDMAQMRSALHSEETNRIIKDLKLTFEGKTLLLGVDDMDIFKGIGAKFAAMGQLLDQAPKLRGKVVMIQIANPARSEGDDIREFIQEIRDMADDVNSRYGNPAEFYQPIILIERAVTTAEKAAYYSLADCCVVMPVRDGMNLVPYKYTACRESAGKSVIVVSEFIGCSPSLSGALRVNPWNVESLADAMKSAITMTEAEQKLRHEKHFKYVTSHDVGYWSQSLDQDLRRACADHWKKRCYGIGLSFGFRVVALDPNFRRLAPEKIAAVYQKTSHRLLLLDYDGTMTPMYGSSQDQPPTEDVLRTLNKLCKDPKNTVFVVSGRGKDTLAKWFGNVKKLGIAAEHGYFTRWSTDVPWETHFSADMDWKTIVEPIMQHYTDATDGSNIEFKESALVWHHKNADPDFGSCQSKELLDHLENVLANDPVVVKRGQHIVEVKPQGISKGVVVGNLISRMVTQGTTPDFVLCVGDDRSDEDMFETITESASLVSAGVFACTVGRKPSKARYYLDDTEDVMRALHRLADESGQDQGPSLPVATKQKPQVSFEGSA